MIIKNIRLLNSDDQIFDFKTRIFYIIDQLEEFDLILLESISKVVNEKHNLSLIGFYYEYLTTGLVSNAFIDLFLEAFFKAEKEKFYELINNDENGTNYLSKIRYLLLWYITFFALKDLSLPEIKKYFYNYTHKAGENIIDIKKYREYLIVIKYDFKSTQSKSIL